MIIKQLQILVYSKCHCTGQIKAPYNRSEEQKLPMVTLRPVTIVAIKCRKINPEISKVVSSSEK